MICFAKGENKPSFSSFSARLLLPPPKLLLPAAVVEAPAFAVMLCTARSVCGEASTELAFGGVVESEELEGASPSPLLLLVLLLLLLLSAAPATFCLPSPASGRLSSKSSRQKRKLPCSLQNNKEAHRSRRDKTVTTDNMQRSKRQIASLRLCVQ